MTTRQDLTLQIVEFTHPGAEYIPKSDREDRHVKWDDTQGRSGIRKWNCLDTHKRKFIRSAGWYLNDAFESPQAASVTFWGEWEAQSRFRLTGRREEPPHCIHTPFLDMYSDDYTKHNTDPYVFGSYFWYTNCKQTHRKFLRSLARNSIILFGTEKEKGFYLDTVFVVGASFCTPIEENILSEASTQLKKVNFEHERLFEKPNFTFYRGLMKEESPAFFSFVPGMPYSGSQPIFHDKPLMTPTNSFGLQRLGARTVCKRLYQDKQMDGSLSLDFVREYWNKVAQLCIDQGFSLITKIEEPYIESNHPCP